MSKKNKPITFFVDHCVSQKIVPDAMRSAGAIVEAHIDHFPIDFDYRLDTIRSFEVQSLALFGSVFRDEATETSDLNFSVKFEGAATFDRFMTWI